MQDVDLKRDRSLLAADWQRYGFTSRHLLNDAAAFIRDADQSLGCDWTPRGYAPGGPAQRFDAEAPRPLTRPRPPAPGSP